MKKWVLILVICCSFGWSVATSENGTPQFLVSPGQGVGDVLLGMYEDEVIAVLGEPEEKSSYDSGSTVYLIYPSAGISVVVAKGKVHSIDLYSGVPTGYVKNQYSRFKGAFENGLNFDSSFDDVVKAFGDPVERFQMKYSTIPTDTYYYGIGVNFVFNTESRQLGQIRVGARNESLIGEESRRRLEKKPITEEDEKRIAKERDNFWKHVPYSGYLSEFGKEDLFDFFTESERQHILDDTPHIGDRRQIITFLSGDYEEEVYETKHGKSYRYSGVESVKAKYSLITADHTGKIDYIANKTR